MFDELFDSKFKGNTPAINLLDIKKAFDTVDHKILMDMFTGACGIILTLKLPKNQQKSFFGNNSLIFMHFLLKIGEQILFTMIGITDLFKK